MTLDAYPLFQAAARPPERITVSQWADRNRIIGTQNAEPGPWSTDRAPYQREIMDSFTASRVVRITFMKPAQVGGTECLFNMKGFIVDQDPGPTLYVMPTEEDAKYIVSQRLKPMFTETAALRQHLTASDWDFTASQITLDRCTLYFGWSNSASRLASKPIRYLFLDEVDKYSQFSGKEADPISLAIARTTTFWNRRIVIASTPTTKNGNIWREWVNSDQRHYWVPCPHCNRYQVLAWACIKWPEDERDGNRIEREKLASYFCPHCAAEIADHRKPNMLKAGVWVPEACELQPDGSIIGDTDSPHRGYQISALYSPWLTWSEIAAEFVKAQGQLDKMLHFTNSWLGEPWEDRVGEIKEERLSALSLSYEPGTVPAGAVTLTAGVDVQQDLLYYVIRAWGPKEKSWLVTAGKELHWGDLARVLLDTTYEGEDGLRHKVSLACVDSGHRTDEVYIFARSRSEAVRACKGRDMLAGGLKYSVAHIERRPDTGSVFVGSIDLWHINTDFFKTKLSRYLQEPQPAVPGQEMTSPSPGWHLYNAPTIEYLRQVSSEHRVILRDSRTKQPKPVWMKKPGHNQNHFLDCYSSDTEVLTERGWIEFEHASRTDVFATVNLETRALEYQKASGFTRRPHDGDMVQVGGVRGSRANLLVTPGHRMIGYRHSHDHTPGAFKAEDLTPSCRLLTGAAWKGEQCDDIFIPSAGRMPPVTVKAEDLAEFMGWYIAEGSKWSSTEMTSKRVTLYQNRGPKREDMRAVLERLPWKYHETERGFVIANSQVFSVIEECGWTRTKRVPEWIRKATPGVIEAFLRGAVAGDGWTHKVTGARSYATVCKALAGDIAELFIKIGGWPVIHTRAAQPYCIHGRSGHNTRTQYWVQERQPATVHMRNSKGQPIFKRVHFKGEVACATVPNGTLIVRRGGKVVICGNCELLSMAAADMLGTFDVRIAPGLDGVAVPVVAEEPVPVRREERRRGWVSGGGRGWMTGRRRR